MKRWLTISAVLVAIWLFSGAGGYFWPAWPIFWIGFVCWKKTGWHRVHPMDEAEADHSLGVR